MVGRAHPALAFLALPLLLTACAEGRKAEDADWYSAADELDVSEQVAFTDQAYAFPAAGPGIADLPVAGQRITLFEPTARVPEGCGYWETDDGLPVEFEAMVTLHPRMYMKVGGCIPDGSDADSDEKYYGSFFIEDATGGIFVLGDSKVAHFDMGDRVRIRVRAIKNNFDLQAVAAHDIVEIIRGPEPIFYTEVDRALDDTDVGRVRRVTGTVSDWPDTFGEFHIDGPDGQYWTAGLDVELNRRGVQFAPGTEVQITAPVIFSFDTYTLVIMKIGQVTVLQD